MALEVGKTHDIVVLLNDTQELGLTVKPHTYRLGRAPEFVPRIGAGAPSAGDFDHWRAYLQNKFSLGEGADEFTALEGLESFQRGYGLTYWPAGLGPALLPRATSMQGPLPLALSCDADIYIVEMSNAPRLLHKQLLYTHTNDQWVATHTQMGGDASSVVMHSNVMFVGFGGVQAHKAYGSSPSPLAAKWYVPEYDTTGSILWNYDRKLWRAYGHRVAHLTPTTGWSAFIEVGTADAPVLNVAVAFGRVYFGKRDSLWCYEGGRVYEVEPFYAEASDDNFTLMHASHGALYFNIKNHLYRYTGGGNIELLWSYPYRAILGPGTVAQEKLYFSVRDESHSGSLYTYDFRKRGVFNELDLHSEVARHTVHNVAHVTGLGVAADKLWIAPVESTAEGLTSAADPLFEDQTDTTTSPAHVTYGLYTRYAGRRTCLNSGSLAGLRFYLIGSYVDMEFCVYADDGGSPGAPTGAPLASVTVPSDHIGGSWSWVTGMFATPLAVTAGTKYHLVCQTAGDATASVNLHLYRNGALDTFHRYDGSWNYLGPSYDICVQHLPVTWAFRAYGTRVVELPSRRIDTPPVGYGKAYTGFTRMYTPWLNLGYPSLAKYVNELTLETVLEGIGAQLNVHLAVDGGEGVAVEGVVQEYSASNYEDHTANLVDGDATTYVDFEWGAFPDQKALFSHINQYFYICGAKRFDTIVWKLRDSIYHSREFTSPVGDLLLEVWTGAEWRRVLVREDTTQVGGWVWAQSGQWTIRPPRQWEKRTLQGKTGYFLRVFNRVAPPDCRQNNQRLYELNLVAHSAESQDFASLGSATEVGDALTTLDVHQVATRIALMFEFVGSREASAFLKSFKVSFNPVGQGKREIHVVVKAWDEIKQLDGEMEASAAYIVQAVQSMHDAGLLYTVGLPFPTPHSINAQVQLGESILVPLLVYTAQTGKSRLIPRADIPLRIIEG